jgi:hypothetical protein
MSLGARSSPTPSVLCAAAGSCPPQSPSGNGGGQCCANDPSCFPPPDSSFSAQPGRYRNGTIYDALWFDLVGTTYGARFYVQDTLVHDTANQQYIHTDTLGRVTTSYDYNAATPTPQQGQFKSFTDLGGNVTTATYDATTHLITSFMRSSRGSRVG